MEIMIYSQSYFSRVSLCLPCQSFSIFVLAKTLNKYGEKCFWWNNYFPECQRTNFSDILVFIFHPTTFHYLLLRKTQSLKANSDCWCWTMDENGILNRILSVWTMISSAKQASANTIYALFSVQAFVDVVKICRNSMCRH